MTAREDQAIVARQLAALTQTVEEMAGQLKEVRERAENEQERTDIQQERIDLAARELSSVTVCKLPQTRSVSHCDPALPN